MPQDFFTKLPPLHQGAEPQIKSPLGGIAQTVLNRRFQRQAIKADAEQQKQEAEEQNKRVANSNTIQQQALEEGRRLTPAEIESVSSASGGNAGHVLNQFDNNLKKRQIANIIGEANTGNGVTTRFTNDQIKRLEGLTSGNNLQQLLRNNHIASSSYEAKEIIDNSITVSNVIHNRQKGQELNEKYIRSVVEEQGLNVGDEQNFVKAVLGANSAIQDIENKIRNLSTEEQKQVLSSLGRQIKADADIHTQLISILNQNSNIKVDGKGASTYEVGGASIKSADNFLRAIINKLTPGGGYRASLVDRFYNQSKEEDGNIELTLKGGVFNIKKLKETLAILSASKITEDNIRVTEGGGSGLGGTNEELNKTSFNATDPK